MILVLSRGHTLSLNYGIWIIRGPRVCFLPCDVRQLSHEEASRHLNVEGNACFLQNRPVTSFTLFTLLRMLTGLRAASGANPWRLMQNLSQALLSDWAHALACAQFWQFFRKSLHPPPLFLLRYKSQILSYLLWFELFSCATDTLVATRRSLEEIV